MSIGFTEWMLIAVVVVLVFGRGKVSELMGDVAKGIKRLKKCLAEDDDTPPVIEASTCRTAPKVERDVVAS